MRGKKALAVALTRTFLVVRFRDTHFTASGLLAAGVFGHGLCTFGHGVLGQLSWE